MDYTNLFTRAWHVVWNNKFMFILGFLASLGGGGSGGGGGSTNQSFNTTPGGGTFDPNNPPDFEQMLPPGFMDNIEAITGLIVALVCFMFILSIVFWMVRNAAAGSMIHAAATVEAGGKSSFGEAFAAGTGALGRMLGLSLSISLPFIILFSVIMAGVFVPLMGAISTGGDPEEAFAGVAGLIGCVALLFCLLFPLLFVVMLVHPFAQRGVVLRSMGVFESIKHGWEIVSSHVTDIFLIGLFLWVIGLVFGFVIGIASLPFLGLFAAPVLDIMAGNELGASSIAMIVGGSVCLGIVTAIINSVYTAYKSSVATLAYMEFTNLVRAETVEPKLSEF